MGRVKDILLRTVLNNKVVILFAILCIAAIYTAQNPLTFVASELFTRIGRNGFMVLALLIPVLAGMGLNFGIVIGAIAAQIAVFWTVYWGFEGSSGFLLCLLLSTPLAIFFGWLVGKLFNRMKGAEMIAGLILGYFADGLYQLFFLYIIGGIIPVSNPRLIISGGIGVKNTIDLTGNLKYSLDNISSGSMLTIACGAVILVTVVKIIAALAKREGIPKKTWLALAGALIMLGLVMLPPVSKLLSAQRLLLLHGVLLALAAVIAKQAWLMINNRLIGRRKDYPLGPRFFLIALALAGVLLTCLKPAEEILMSVEIPIATYLCILGLYLFNAALLKTRLGQNMRTVGQSQTVAHAAGIDVNRTRIIAMIISTTLACWGQLIYLQNIGTFSTYGAHTQVGQYAIAALLVGGASVQKATAKQAVIGVILFHTLFIVAPQAGKELFNNAQLGEYFRVFVAYGVIAVSLAMHAWKTAMKPKKPLEA
ncbi:MAG: ABC transporter permease subunit [Bacillota bacterium]